jgi:hypothetical protein
MKNSRGSVTLFCGGPNRRIRVPPIGKFKRQNEIMMKATADELIQIVNDVVPLLQTLQEPQIAQRPAPKKWSQKEILGHLIDSACNNQQKIVRMMQQPHLDFPGYRQDDWVDLQNWAAADWSEMIVLWAAYNRHIAFLIKHVDSKYLKNTITIEGTGPFTLEFIMPDYVEHLKHHLKQIFPDINLENRFANVYNA